MYSLLDCELELNIANINTTRVGTITKQRLRVRVDPQALCTAHFFLLRDVRYYINISRALSVSTV